MGARMNIMSIIQENPNQTFKTIRTTACGFSFILNRDLFSRDSHKP